MFWNHFSFQPQINLDPGSLRIIHSMTSAYGVRLKPFQTLHSHSSLFFFYNSFFMSTSYRQHPYYAVSFTVSPSGRWREEGGAIPQAGNEQFGMRGERGSVGNHSRLPHQGPLWSSIAIPCHPTATLWWHETVPLHDTCPPQSTQLLLLLFPLSRCPSSHISLQTSTRRGGVSSFKTDTIADIPSSGAPKAWRQTAG